MKNSKNVIPGIFTTLNLFCGFLAIIKIFDDRIIHGCWLIVLAAVFDTLDGQFARLTKSSSHFGIEFDSLADVVSFGVAPAILLYQVYFEKFGILGIMLGFSPLIAGTVRLARFNVQITDSRQSYFSGLPITMAALTFAAFFIFQYHLWDELILTRIMVPQVALVCILMVSTIKYYAFPKFPPKFKQQHTFLIILLVIGIVFFVLFPQETLYPVCIIYILYGILQSILRIIKTTGNNNNHNDLLNFDEKK